MYRRVMNLAALAIIAGGAHLLAKPAAAAVATEEYCCSGGGYTCCGTAGCSADASGCKATDKEATALQ